MDTPGSDLIDSENMFNTRRFCKLLFMTHSLRVVDCYFLLHILKQSILVSGHKSAFVPKKSRTTSRDIHDATLGSPAFHHSGSATFCPYLSIGLAFIFIRRCLQLVYALHATARCSINIFIQQHLSHVFDHQQYSALRAGQI
jgi:hypothetical protein